MHTYRVAQDADDKLTFNLLNPSPGPITPLVPMNYSPTERKLLSRSCPVMTEVYEAEAIALLGMTPLGAWLKVHGDRYDLNGQTIFGYGGPLSITFRDPNAAMHFKLKWV